MNQLGLKNLRFLIQGVLLMVSIQASAQLDFPYLSDFMRPDQIAFSGENSVQITTRYNDLVREYVDNERVGIFRNTFNNITIVHGIKPNLVISSCLEQEKWHGQRTTRTESYEIENIAERFGVGASWCGENLRGGFEYRADQNQNQQIGRFFASFPVFKSIELGYEYQFAVNKWDTGITADSSQFFPDIGTWERRHKVYTTLKYKKLVWSNTFGIPEEIPGKNGQPSHHSLISVRQFTRYLTTTLEYQNTENRKAILGFEAWLFQPRIQLFWDEQPLGQINAQADTLIFGKLAYQFRRTNLSCMAGKLTNYSHLQSRTYPFTSTWADLSGTFFYSSNNLRVNFVLLDLEHGILIARDKINLDAGLLYIDGTMETSRHTWSFLESIKNYKSGTTSIDRVRLLFLRPTWNHQLNEEINLVVRLTQAIPVGGTIRSDKTDTGSASPYKFTYRGGLAMELTLTYSYQ